MSKFPTGFADLSFGRVDSDMWVWSTAVSTGIVSTIGLSTSSLGLEVAQSLSLETRSCVLSCS